MRRVILVIFASLTMTGVALLEPRALLIFILDLPFALMVLVPAALGGLWLVPLFGLRSVPMRWHLLAGAGLGLGAASILTLGLGWIGVFDRTVWAVLAVISCVAGAARLQILWARRDLLQAAPTHGDAPDAAAKGHDTKRPDSGFRSALWLALVPFAALAIVATTSAPGMIRPEEGYGYDVLEYHLQMPREYLERGRIEYAPHNVYASFPANVEMLYLLVMVALGDTADAGTATNVLHLLLGALAVFAAWVAGRDGLSRSGVIAAVALGSTGWLAYMAGLAYVEHGLLFFGGAALAAMLRGLKSDDPEPAGTDAPARLGWFALSGVFAGLACGCKYTAVPMLAIPLGFALILVPRWRVPQRVMCAGVFLLACGLAFSPWLIKNTIMTGNPVFPLASGVFEARPAGWGEKEAAQWQRGHALPETDRGPGARLKALWSRIPADVHQRFGPAILLLPLLGLFKRRLCRLDLLLILLVLGQLGVWLLATHLYARFAVLLLPPLAVLCGRAAANAGRRRLALVIAAVVAGAGWNLAFAWDVHREDAPHGLSADLIYSGKLPQYEFFAAVNEEWSLDAKVLLVGEARAFYFQRRVDYFVVFNRNPFVEVVQSAPDARAVVDWLRAQGYTHVLVNWVEVDRLRRSYGFAPEITPELFARLEHAGLTRERDYLLPDGRLHVSTFRVEQ